MLSSEHVCVPVDHKVACKWKTWYLEGGILEAKAVGWAFDLREEGTTRGIAEEGGLWALGELKNGGWWFRDGAGTGVLGGTGGPAGLGKGPEKLKPL